MGGIYEGGFKGVELEDGFHPKGAQRAVPLAQPPPASQQSPMGSNLQGRILDLPYNLL